MVNSGTALIAVNHFTGKLKQPIKLEILATGAAVDVDSLTVIGFMIKAIFCLLKSTPAVKTSECLIHVALNT